MQSLTVIILLIRAVSILSVLAATATATAAAATTRSTGATADQDEDKSPHKIPRTDINHDNDNKKNSNRCDDEVNDSNNSNKKSNRCDTTYPNNKSNRMEKEMNGDSNKYVSRSELVPLTVPDPRNKGSVITNCPPNPKVQVEGAKRQRGDRDVCGVKMNNINAALHPTSTLPLPLPAPPLHTHTHPLPTIIARTTNIHKHVTLGRPDDTNLGGGRCTVRPSTYKHTGPSSRTQDTVNSDGQKNGSTGYDDVVMSNDRNPKIHTYNQFDNNNNNKKNNNNDVNSNDKYKNCDYRNIDDYHNHYSNNYNNYFMRNSRSGDYECTSDSRFTSNNSNNNNMIWKEDSKPYDKSVIESKSADVMNERNNVSNRGRNGNIVNNENKNYEDEYVIRYDDNNIMSNCSHNDNDYDYYNSSNNRNEDNDRNSGDYNGIHNDNVTAHANRSQARMNSNINRFNHRLPSNLNYHILNNEYQSSHTIHQSSRIGRIESKSTNMNMNYNHSHNAFRIESKNDTESDLRSVTSVIGDSNRNTNSCIEKNINNNNANKNSPMNVQRNFKRNVKMDMTVRSNSDDNSDSTIQSNDQISNNNISGCNSFDKENQENQKEESTHGIRNSASASATVQVQVESKVQGQSIKSKGDKDNMGDDEGDNEGDNDSRGVGVDSENVCTAVISNNHIHSDTTYNSNSNKDGSRESVRNSMSNNTTEKKKKKKKRKLLEKRIMTSDITFSIIKEGPSIPEEGSFIPEEHSLAQELYSTAECLFPGSRDHPIAVE